VWRLRGRRGRWTRPRTALTSPFLGCWPESGSGGPVEGVRFEFSNNAVHLVAGSTTSPVLAQIAGAELARPFVNASVERSFRAYHIFTCILLQSSNFHRLFECIRSVSGSASYDVQGHSGNAHVQTYADAQQARASSPVLSTRCFRDFCSLALGPGLTKSILARVSLEYFFRVYTHTRDFFRCTPNTHTRRMVSEHIPVPLNQQGYGRVLLILAILENRYPSPPHKM